MELGDDAGHLRLICARNAEMVQPTSVRRENGGSPRLVVLSQGLLPISARLAQQIKEDGEDNGLMASMPRFTVSL